MRECVCVSMCVCVVDMCERMRLSVSITLCSVVMFSSSPD